MPPMIPSMRTLRCAVMGQRTVVTVEIEDDTIIPRLKDAILAKRPLGIHPMMLLLYLAKRGGDLQSGWLHTTHEDYEALARGDEQTVAMYSSTDTNMDACLRVKDYFAEQPDEHAQTIHVLVLLPTNAEMDRFRSLGGGDSVDDTEEMPRNVTIVEPEQLPPPQSELLSSWIGRVVRDSMASWTAWMATEDTENKETTKEDETKKSG